MDVLRLTNRLAKMGFRHSVRGSLPCAVFKLFGPSSNAYSSSIKWNGKATATVPLITTKWQKWTTEETQQFHKVMEQFTPPYPWQEVADHLGMGKSSSQCEYKWRSQLHNTWSEDETKTLRDLVAKTAQNPGSEQLNEEDADWKAIGKALRKRAAACRMKWRDIHNPGVVERIFRDQNVAWSAELLERLTDSVRQFHGRRISWNIVAGDVGHGKSATICKARYHNYSFRLNTHNGEQGAKELWTEEKVAMLHQLVKLHTTLDKASGDAATDWIAVGKGLGRKPSLAQLKWRHINLELSNRNKHVNHYTPEEDALIMRHVEEWGKDTKRGLWKSLDDKLGRRHVRYRWLALRNGVENFQYWTEDMDKDLVKVRKDVLGSKTKSSKSDDARIADRMNRLGWPVSASQCESRYNRVVKHRLNGCAIKVIWTKELTASMMELRAKGTSWNEISAALHVGPTSCKSKYREESTKHLKRGSFSAEEDALLRQRVAEWGDPRQKKGLWKRLQKEMGRPSKALRARWDRCLSHKIVG